MVWVEGDLNPHGFPHQILSLARMPIPPSTRKFCNNIRLFKRNFNRNRWTNDEQAGTLCLPVNTVITIGLLLFFHDAVDARDQIIDIVRLCNEIAGAEGQAFTRDFHLVDSRQHNDFFYKILFANLS